MKQNKSYLKHNKDETNILFTQQGGVKEFLLESIEKSPRNYKWFVRFHPRLIRDERMDFIRRIKALNINVDFENSNNMNLFDLLSHMDIHITEYFSSFFEA